MTQAQQDYQKIHELSRKAKVLHGVESLLHWDQETYMPEKASVIRSEQIQTLAKIVHEERTSNSFKNALEKLITIKTGEVKGNSLKPEQKAALREWRRDFVKQTSLPTKFVQDFAKHCSESIFIWQRAKNENNFKAFLPSLTKMVEMCRKKADYLGFEDHPYDALLDEYEPHMLTKDVADIFRSLQDSTVKLLKQIQSKKQVDDAFLRSSYPEEKQKAFNKILLDLIQFPKDIGRLDLSTHPFSSSCHPYDNRITTQIIPKLPMSNIRSVLHECGHAFYEMGLPAEQYGTPLGEAVSLGIHESQSRFWETRIGMSKGFAKLCLPLMKQSFKGKLDEVTPEAFWRAVNKVEPSFIRVEADEVTYALHVILRFELEIRLIEGSLKPAEIPEAWNEKMQQLLGIRPKTDAQGCLQDIHWSMGGFGYFSTYTLGNLYAAQFFLAFAKEFPEWEKRVEKGEFHFIKEWLTRNIHHHGRRYSSKELVKKVSGKEFSAKPFEEYLKEKYTRIYKL